MSLPESTQEEVIKLQKNDTFSFPSPPASKWKTAILTQIYQGLCSNIFSRWCSWIGSTAPLCNSYIYLVPQWTFPGIATFSIFWTWPLPTTPDSIFTTQIKVSRLRQSMICLDKLRQAYMLAALNTKEAHSKQGKHKCNDIPNLK